MGISRDRIRELWADPVYRERQSKSHALAWSDPDKRARIMDGHKGSRDKISAGVKAAWKSGAYSDRRKPAPPPVRRVLPVMTNHQFHQYTAMRKAGISRDAAAAAAAMLDPTIKNPPHGVAAEKYRFIDRLEVGESGEVLLSDMSYESSRENIRNSVWRAQRIRALRFGRRFSMKSLKDRIIVTRMS